jgi:hypothetical protein
LVWNCEDCFCAYIEANHNKNLGLPNSLGGKNTNNIYNFAISKERYDMGIHNKLIKVVWSCYILQALQEIRRRPSKEVPISAPLIF